MRKKSATNLALIFCWAVLMFFFISIMTRFLTRQILVKRLHWDNAFTRIVFLGNQAMSEDVLQINWANEYPFRNLVESSGTKNISKLTRFENIVFNVEDKIKVYTTDLLIGQNSMKIAAKGYNNLIGCQVMGTEELIFLKNGYLAWKEDLISDSDIAEIADSVQDFSIYLDHHGIDFVYANTGSKVCPYDKQLPAGANEHTNDNGDNLIGALKDRNVNTLDFRDYMIQDGLDWYQSYYITDQHWKTTTALWAAGVMAQYLNDHFEFEFDRKFFDPSSYDIETYPDYFLGGQGQLLLNCNLDAYDTILPKFDTSFSLIIPSRDIDVQGSYEDVLFNKEALEEMAKDSERSFAKKGRAYGLTRLSNDAYAEIKNLDPENNRDKKILLIYDSFSWYLASYLATDVSEIVTLHLKSFNGSVRTLVDEMEPDAVIMAYCERNINSIENWKTHTELFDLR